MSAKSRVRPHLFVADPDVPPDQNGRGACRECHRMGEPGDVRHTLPDAPEQVEHLRRYDPDVGLLND